jgi:CRP/FNR family cyclic AMP-dependent transcriptional regulator
MTTPAVAELLQATTFAGFDPAILARLGALGRLIELPEGATPIREGAVCDWLGVVITGRFGLRLRLPGGQDRTILSVEPGDVVGWSTVLSPAVATSTAVAVLPTTAVVFDGVPLRDALASDCALAAALYERLLGAVARRLVATRLQLLDLYRPVAEPW